MKCAECLYVPQYCNTISDSTYWVFCANGDECCCVSIHVGSRKGKKKYFAKNANLAVKDDDCCLEGTCNDNVQSDKNNSVRKSPSIFQFFKNVKGLYAAALGIEILCISAAEIGEILDLLCLGTKCSQRIHHQSSKHFQEFC